MNKKLILCTGLLLAAGPQLLEAGCKSCRRAKKAQRKNIYCKKCGGKLFKRGIKCPNPNCNHQDKK